MKKTICAVLCVFLLLLAGCGGKTKASQKAISVAQSAINVADDYLDHKLTYEQADEKLSNLREDMEYVDDLGSEDANKATDFSIDAGILILSSAILNDSISETSETYDEVIEARNSIAEDAGLKKR